MDISVEQMYRIENNGHAMGFEKKFMMENAGAAACRRLVENTAVESKDVTVLAGLGNNGGDGMVVARHLAGYGARVRVELLGEPGAIRTDEAAWNWSILEKMPSISLYHGDIHSLDHSPDIVIDAMLGTGISGDIREPYTSAIEFANSAGSFVLAIDVPTGLDPQTGRTASEFVKADITVTFHRMKAGIPTRPEITGRIFVEKIGIPVEAERGIL